MSSKEHVSLSSQVVARIGREVADLHAKPPAGVRLADCESLGQIVADLDGPDDTAYAGGTFSVKLLLGQRFPTDPPRGFFNTKIWHPNISNTGEICVNTLKKDWHPEVTLSHVFQVIRCLLIVPFPESSLNDEAGKQFMDNYEAFLKRARLYTETHAARRKIASGDDDGCGAGMSTSPGAGQRTALQAGQGENRATTEVRRGEQGSEVKEGQGQVKRKMGTGLRDVQPDKRAKESRDSKKRGLKRL